MKKIYLVMETREHPYLKGDTNAGYAIRAFKTRKKAEKFLNEYVDDFLVEYKDNIGESMVDVKPRICDHIFFSDPQLDIWEKIMPERMLESSHPHNEYTFRKRYFIRVIDLDLEIR